jgi:hypothetical protein
MNKEAGHWQCDPNSENGCIPHHTDPALLQAHPTPKIAISPSPEMRPESARPSEKVKETKNGMHAKKKKNWSRSRSPPIAQTRGRSPEPKVQVSAESSRRDDDNNRLPTNRAASQHNARVGKSKKPARHPKSETPPPSDAPSYTYAEEQEEISQDKERTAREHRSTRTNKDTNKAVKPLAFQQRSERKLGILLSTVPPSCPLGHVYEFTRLLHIDKDLQRELEPKCYNCFRCFAVDSSLTSCHRCTPIRISCVKCAFFANEDE